MLEDVVNTDLKSLNVLLINRYTRGILDVIEDKMVNTEVLSVSSVIKVVGVPFFPSPWRHHSSLIYCSGQLKSYEDTFQYCYKCIFHSQSDLT